MELPVMPPVKPMLAKAVTEIPDLGHTEPKWDGFRTIVFRDGDEVVLGSRSEKPLTRYFPELIEALKASIPISSGSTLPPAASSSLLSRRRQPLSRSTCSPLPLMT